MTSVLQVVFGQQILWPQENGMASAPPTWRGSDTGEQLGMPEEVHGDASSGHRTLLLLREAQQNIPTMWPRYSKKQACHQDFSLGRRRYLGIHSYR
jgi:hypothetical protein